MDARDLITPFYTSEMADREYPHLTYEERLPCFEFEVIERARELLRAKGYTVASEAIEAAQERMRQDFERVLASTEGDREMIRTPADVGAYYECDDYDLAARAVSKYADNAYLGMSAFDESCVTIGVYTDETPDAEEVHFSRTLHFPFTREQFSEAWSAVEAEREAYLSDCIQEVV